MKDIAKFLLIITWSILLVVSQEHKEVNRYDSLSITASQELADSNLSIDKRQEGGSGEGEDDRLLCLRLYSRVDLLDEEWFDLCTSNPQLSYWATLSVKSACTPAKYHWLLFEYPNYTGRYAYLKPDICASRIGVQRVGSVLRCLSDAEDRLTCQFPVSKESNIASSQREQQQDARQKYVSIDLSNVEESSAPIELDG